MEALTHALEPMVWTRVRLSLRNLRNTYAREHPLCIFDAILRCVRNRLAEAEQRPYFFHPTAAVGPRIRKDRVYELELVFPRAAARETVPFFEAARQYLAEPRHNFSLEAEGAPEERNLALLLREPSRIWDAPQPEITLRFETPYPFPTRTKERREERTAAELIEDLVARVNRLFGTDLKADPAWAEAVRTLWHFWHYEEIRHESKSRGGLQYLQGCRGPLYLRGDWPSLYPLLVLGAELHASCRECGFSGYYRIARSQPFFDAALKNPLTYRSALLDLRSESDLDDDWLNSLHETEDLCAELAEAACSGTYAPEPAEAMPIEKEGGGERVLALLRPRDKVLHKTLHGLLAPVLDRVFQPGSFGYRVGRSTKTARREIVQAVRDGCTHAVETDIAAFFDEVDWTRMEGCLEQALPLADGMARRLVATCLRAPLRRKRTVVERTRGLLQGSPLSPLLANLYLDGFDEAVASLGYRMIRYGDDLLVPTQSAEEAETALARIRELLEGVGLRLAPEKTGVTRLDEGLAFLGFTVDADMEDEWIGETALRKPLFVRTFSGLLSVDGGSVLLRQGGKLVERVPLARISEIVLLGNLAIGSQLIHQCTGRGIPISFCSPSGFYINILRPDSKHFHEMGGRHLLAFEHMHEEPRTEIARDLVRAKLANYRVWFHESRPAGHAQIVAQLDRATAKLGDMADVEQLRGAEGAAAAFVFGRVHRRIRVGGFESEGRVPRKKPDRYNSLLDFGYYLVFTRLNVLLRAQGLNPYLGFLHSHADRYESLVCDLLEPFRCRTDRFVVRLINLRQVTPDDFRDEGEAGFRLAGPATGRFLQAFEAELETGLTGDAGTFKQMLQAQVFRLKYWALGERPMTWYRSRSYRQPVRNAKRGQRIRKAP